MQAGLYCNSGTNVIMQLLALQKQFYHRQFERARGPPLTKSSGFMTGMKLPSTGAAAPR